MKPLHAVHLKDSEIIPEDLLRELIQKGNGYGLKDVIP